MDEATKLLRELVACKDLNERARSISPVEPGCEREILMEEWRNRDCAAWAAARAYLSRAPAEAPPRFKRLRELALAATPGPWQHTCYMSGTQNVEYPGSRGVTFVDQVLASDASEICHESDCQKFPWINVDHRPEDKGNDADPQRTRNGMYIAACDPQTILALLDAAIAEGKQP